MFSSYLALASLHLAMHYGVGSIHTPKIMPHLASLRSCHCLRSVLLLCHALLRLAPVSGFLLVCGIISVVEKRQKLRSRRRVGSQKSSIVKT